MAVQLYLGVRLPEKPYEKIALNGVQISKKIIDLKQKAEEILKHPNKELG